MEANVRGFLAYLRGEKGLAANTIAAYRRDIDKFAAFMQTKGRKLPEITHSDVVDFLRSLYAKKLDSRSVARHLVTIRHFFRFCVMEKVLVADAVRERAGPEIPHTLPEFLSAEEVNRLLAQPDISNVSRPSRQGHDRAAVSFGPTRFRTVRAESADLQTEAGCLRCMAKGDKERLVPVGRQALEKCSNTCGIAAEYRRQNVANLFLNRAEQSTGFVSGRI